MSYVQCKATEIRPAMLFMETHYCFQTNPRMFTGEALQCFRILRTKSRREYTETAP